MPETQVFEVVTQDDLREVLADRPGPAVSLYQPTHRGADAEQDVLRFKNLLNDAEDRLMEHGPRRLGAKPLQPMRAMLNNGEFWRHQLDGLAMFSAGEFFRFFKLPFEVEELLVVGDRIHATPLFEASMRGYFYILAISRSSVRLIRATRFGAEEIDLSDVEIPHSFDEAMRYDDFEKSNLQRHPAVRTGAGAGRTMQHGHGPGDEDLKKEISRYFQAVDRGVTDLLRVENAPLVLAAVDYLHPLYRGASNYRSIVQRGIEGNPEQLSPAQLKEEAWPLVEPHFRSRLEEAKEKYGNGTSNGTASCELLDVLAASHEGRVGALIVQRGRRRWGLFDLTRNLVEERVEPRHGDVDLIDLAARQTALHGGDVFLTDGEDMPCDEALAAVFRF
jgi:Bacterial archaeo-eukaryotic release factor family 7